jgi:hypothetical protein
MNGIDGGCLAQPEDKNWESTAINAYQLALLLFCQF